MSHHCGRRGYWCCSSPWSSSPSPSTDLDSARGERLPAIVQSGFHHRKLLPGVLGIGMTETEALFKEAKTAFEQALCVLEVALLERDAGKIIENSGGVKLIR